jgi:rare lipoprotein A
MRHICVALMWALCGASVIITAACIVMAWSTFPAHAAECGKASFYGAESGSRTASGERFRPSGLSIAMRSYAFGKRYRVTFGGRTVIVRHNDYGPARWTGRKFDLSIGAARQLGMTKRGVATVCVSTVR